MTASAKSSALLSLSVSLSWLSPQTGSATPMSYVLQLALVCPSWEAFRKLFRITELRPLVAGGCSRSRFILSPQSDGPSQD